MRGGGESITSVPKPLVRQREFIVLDVSSYCVPHCLVCPYPAPSPAWQPWPYCWTTLCSASGGSGCGWGDIKPP